eukprot:SAG11_NODE_2743_length_3020_cov_1.882574_3_plen_82_part_00
MPSLKPQFVVARQGQAAEAVPPRLHRTGRVSTELVTEAFDWLGGRPTAVYVCGPPGMAEEMVATLEGLEVPADRVHFEQWW